jgi:hypothetical protein
VELDSILIADAATVVGEKFFVHGGGLTRYEIPGVPVQIPIEVLIRVLLADDDLDREVRLELTLLGPQGIPNVEPVEIRAINRTPAAGEVADGQQQFMQLALGIPAVAMREGLYHLELRLDGELVKSIPFPVIVNPGLVSLSPSPEPTSGKPSPKRKPKTKRPPPPPRKAKRPRR